MADSRKRHTEEEDTPCSNIMRQEIYLVKEKCIKIDTAFNGEYIRLMVQLTNHSGSSLYNVRIGEVTEAGYDIMDGCMAVYLEGCLLVREVDYVLLKKGEGVPSECTFKQGVMVQLKQPVKEGEVLRLTVDACVASQEGQKEIRSLGLVHFNGEKDCKMQSITTEEKTLKVIAPRLTIKEEVSQGGVKIGEAFRHELIITNRGNIDLEQVFFRDDALWQALENGMVKLDKTYGIQREKKKIGEALPANIGRLAVGEKALISLRGTVVKLPPDKKLISEAQVVTSAISRESEGVPSAYCCIRTFARSDRVMIEVQEAPVALSLEKLLGIGIVDQRAAEPGDLLTYQLILHNVGKDECSEIILSSLLDEQLHFLPYSLQINGEPVFGEIKHLVLPNLKGEETLVIGFKAQIKGETTRSQVTTVSQVTYLTPQGERKTVAIEEMQTRLVCRSTYFCMPLTLHPIGRGRRIQEVTEMATELLEVTPYCTSQGMCMKLLYKMRLGYREQGGVCRSYTSTQQVSVPGREDKQYQRFILWMQDAKLIDKYTIRAMLYIRAYF